MAKTVSSTVYNINYHIAWCTKYRRKILVGSLKKFLDQEIQKAESKGTILALQYIFQLKPLRDTYVGRKNIR